MAGSINCQQDAMRACFSHESSVSVVLSTGFGCISPRRIIVVLQYAMRGTFQIVELPAAYAPQEGSADHECQHDRKWNEQIKDVHEFTGPARQASPALDVRANSCHFHSAAAGLSASSIPPAAN